MADPKVTVHHADGSETVAVGRVSTFESPNGTVFVDCATCPVTADGMRTGFFVDVLDPRLPDGPFQCEECVKGAGR